MSGNIDSLEGFLSRFFPGLKIFHRMDSNAYDVWLPENPARLIAEKAVDEAFERHVP